MTDTSRTLEHYRLTDGSKVMMLGDVDAALGQISDLVQKANDIMKQPQDTLKENIKAGEMLLQTLLKLDGVECSSDAVRQSRKEAVRTIQQLLDQVDKQKEKLKP
jgi:hypothetical protein